MATLRRTSAPGGPWYEFYREVCPICGHKGMCMIHEDQNRVVCCRIESKIEWAKNSSLPGYLHFLNGNDRPKVDLSTISVEKEQPKKDDQHLNRVFRALLAETTLRKEHLEILTSKQRGMVEEEIIIRQYRSFPEKPWETTKKIIERLGDAEDLIGVPGFYSKEGKYNRYFTLNGYPKSILIPFRNIKNQIVGFQWRVDEVKNQIVHIKTNPDLNIVLIEQPNKVKIDYKGKTIFTGEVEIKKDTPIKAKGRILGEFRVEKGNRYMWLSSSSKESGTGAGPLPVHVAVPTKILKDWKVGTTLKTKVVTVTEGPIKADKSAELFDILLTDEEKAIIGTVVLSIPGVNSWRIMLPILKEMGVEIVNLAFDADVQSNPQVQQHLFLCAKELISMGIKINILGWEEAEGKGLDDVLLNQIIPIIVPIKIKNKV